MVAPSKLWLPRQRPLWWPSLRPLSLGIPGQRVVVFREGKPLFRNGSPLLATLDEEGNLPAECCCGANCFCQGTQPIAYLVELTGVADKVREFPFDCSDGLCVDYNGLSFEVPLNTAGDPPYCSYTANFEGEFCDSTTFVIEVNAEEDAIIVAVGVGAIALDVTFTTEPLTFPIDCTQHLTLTAEGSGIGIYCDWSVATMTLTPVFA